MGRIVLFLLMSLSIHAQVVTNHITIGGERYEFVGDMNMELRTQPQRPIRYSSLRHDDLNTYLMSFVRDAIYNGEDLNLAVNDPYSQYVLGGSGITSLINTMRFVDHDSFYGRSSRTGGSSWGSWYPGFIITVSDRIWNWVNSRGKLTLMYHELGHALLRKDHLCDTTEAWVTPNGGLSFQLHEDIFGIMATGACDTRAGGSGYNLIGRFCAPGKSNCESFGEYDFTQWDDLLDHFYGTHVPLRRPGGSVGRATGKGGRVLQPIHD